MADDECRKELEERSKLRLRMLKLESKNAEILVQKRLRREKKTRRRLQEKLDLENKRRGQLEEALRTAGAPEQINLINEKLSQMEQKPSSSNQLPPTSTPSSTTSNHAPNNSPHLPPPVPDRPERLPEQRPVERIKQEREDPPGANYGQQPPREMREPPPQPPIPQDSKHWGYTGIELMNTGAAFWQNYSDSLAQELEMERKSRQQQVEREVKSPLQDRSGYYKNSVMFTSSAT
uniref:Uncharacterized protein LOC114337299 n=1 Tax=Diabrotica virgifera virgifera TaxID=50390 RepID=A0A6P7GEV1_DIAVI